MAAAGLVGLSPEGGTGLSPEGGQGYPVPMPRALKVFRLPIGFHDAYVAAPSQKAAAEAWGSDVAVFARGEAELVTDPQLTKEPLASPGKVIKRLRGTAEEQIAALGTDEASAGRKAAAPARKTAKTSPPKPRPSRAALDKAEAALAAAEASQAETRQELAAREAALARERAALEKKQREERERLEARRDAAETDYEEALRRWRG